MSLSRRNCLAVIFIATFVIIASTLGIYFFIHNAELYSKATYTGDALLRVFPKSEKDQIFLQQFDQLNISAQVWGLPLNPTLPVYMYVKAGAMHRVENVLKMRDLTFSVLIEDVQSLIDREERTMAKRRSQYNSDQFDFEIYHPLEEINAWLNQLSSSSMVSVSSLGQTHEKRDVVLVKISNSPRNEAVNNDKPIIYINCGIHAREWVAVSTCIWQMKQLSDASSAESMKLLDLFDFWFVPVSNPDGYVYSWTSDRMWRKNRRPNQNCYGVDLNRNFDVDFNGTSRNGCSGGYGGPEAGSEAETQMMIELLKSNRNRVVAALFMHSFSQLWLSPYGINTTLAPDYPEMEKVMSQAVDAIKSSYGTEYHYGSFANVLYAASGTALDYCYKELGIVHSYLVELRDLGTNAFMLPIDEILPTAVETWDGIKAMAITINSLTNVSNHP